MHDINEGGAFVAVRLAVAGWTAHRFVLDPQRVKFLHVWDVAMIIALGFVVVVTPYEVRSFFFFDSLIVGNRSVSLPVFT